jgi:hypothetical protein
MTLAWRHREKLTPRFVAWIEHACAKAGVYPPITSDWRDPAANAGASGSSKTSRHLFGEAVDFAIPHTGHGGIVGPLLVALIREADAAGLTPQIEIELVASAKDNHLHVALDPGQSVPAIFGASD